MGLESLNTRSRSNRDALNWNIERTIDLDYWMIFDLNIPRERACPGIGGRRTTFHLEIGRHGDSQASLSQLQNSNSKLHVFGAHHLNESIQHHYYSNENNFLITDKQVLERLLAQDVGITATSKNIFFEFISSRTPRNLPVCHVECVGSACVF